MATAEDQRAGPVEQVQRDQDRVTRDTRQQRQSDQQSGKQHQCGDAAAPAGCPARSIGARCRRRRRVGRRRGGGQSGQAQAAPTSSAASCPATPDSVTARVAATSISRRRGVSGHRLRAMAHTACITTATAATFRPASAPAASAPPLWARPSARAISAGADGSVKPAHAASAPA